MKPVIGLILILVGGMVFLAAHNATALEIQGEPWMIGAMGGFGMLCISVGSFMCRIAYDEHGMYAYREGYKKGHEDGWDRSEQVSWEKYEPPVAWPWELEDGNDKK